MEKRRDETKVGRVLCIGDIHNNYKGLIQALERAEYDATVDTLIPIGDITDGFCKDSADCIDFLMKQPNVIVIRGNHDVWCQDWLQTGTCPPSWLENGGSSTLADLINHPKGNMDRLDFFRHQHDYYIDDKNRAFVHAGIMPMYQTLKENQYRYWLMWDRDMWATANELQNDEIYHDRDLYECFDKYSEIFIGHTSVFSSNRKSRWNVATNPEAKPIKAMNVWNLDTGSGGNGKLTVMDVKTKKYWQSDWVQDLYPKLNISV